MRSDNWRIRDLVSSSNERLKASRELLNVTAPMVAIHTRPDEETPPPSEAAADDASTG